MEHLATDPHECWRVSEMPARNVKGVACRHSCALAGSDASEGLEVKCQQPRRSSLAVSFGPCIRSTCTRWARVWAVVPGNVAVNKMDKVHILMKLSFQWGKMMNVYANKYIMCPAVINAVKFLKGKRIGLRVLGFALLWRGQGRTCWEHLSRDEVNEPWGCLREEYCREIISGCQDSEDGCVHCLQGTARRLEQSEPEEAQSAQTSGHGRGLGFYLERY